MIWLVEDWAFEDENEGGLNETQDKEMDRMVDEPQRGWKQITAECHATMDPASCAYVKCSTSGTCL